jgi:hypothetical protein
MEADEAVRRVDHGRRSLRRREVMTRGEAGPAFGDVDAMGHGLFLI